MWHVKFGLGLLCPPWALLQGRTRSCDANKRGAYSGEGLYRDVWTVWIDLGYEDLLLF